MEQTNQTLHPSGTSSHRSLYPSGEPSFRTPLSFRTPDGSSFGAFWYRCHNRSSSFFSITRNHVKSNPRKLYIGINPRFVSRFTNGTRKMNHRHSANPTAGGDKMAASAGAGTSTTSPSAMHHRRVRPYYVPVRSRTKSENNAVESSAFVSQMFPELVGFTLDENVCEDEVEVISRGQQQPNNMMDTSSDSSTGGGSGSGTGRGVYRATGSQVNQTKSAAAAAAAAATAMPMKKSRSLEDVCRGARPADVGSQTSHEMEFMSSRIQKLKVQD